jgi:hypothetical protein
VKRSALLLVGALALLLSALALKGLFLALPELSHPQDSNRFDARRAVDRLERILGDERPHPVDSAASDGVRARLIAEMRRAGLDPRVTDDFACNGFTRSRTIACARVRNLVATIGPPTGRHLLLSAHYDSTSAGPGAADDGIGVATLLEVAALLRGRALRRPVTFLFNEGEEMGLIGARAFVERNPLAARVDTALNFEARGVEGPAIMFETSRPNRRAIALFASAADRPVANSLSSDLYRLIPNSTDVTVFEERDWTILNLAIIGNETRYHSAGDNLAALDRRSLQHMGDQALALTLAAANRPAPIATGERIYADFLGRQLITLPLLFGLILLAILVAFFLRESWRRRALGRPVATAIAALAGSAVLAWAGQTIVGLIRGGDYWRGYPSVTHLAVYASALAACLLALFLFGDDADRTRLRIGFWFTFLLAGFSISLVASGGSIYFLFPPLAVAAGIALSRWRGAERVGALAGAFLLYLTFGPALALFEELMSNGPHWTFAPLGAAILMPFLIELRPLIARLPRGSISLGAAALLLLGWTAVALTPAYTGGRQQFFTIEYVWDADARQGRWAVNNDGAAVPYETAWQRAELPYSLRKRWAAPAPTIEIAAPAIELLRREMIPGGRRVTLRLTASGSESVALVAPADAALRAAGGGRYVRAFGPAGADDRYVLRCIGRSCDGAVLDLVIGGTGPVDLMLVGTRRGLPPAAAPLVRARPALARPQYAPDSTIAIARIRV